MARKIKDLVGPGHFRRGPGKGSLIRIRFTEPCGHSHGGNPYGDIGRYVYASGQRPCVRASLERRLESGALTQEEADDEVYRIHCHQYGNEEATAIHQPPVNGDLLKAIALPKPKPWEVAAARFDETGDEYFAHEACVLGNLDQYEETGNLMFLEAAEFAMGCLDASNRQG